MGKLEPLDVTGGDVKWCSCSGEQADSVLKTKTELPYGPAIPHLGTCPKSLETGTQTNTYAPVLSAASFTTAKT